MPTADRWEQIVTSLDDVTARMNALLLAHEAYRADTFSFPRVRMTRGQWEDVNDAWVRWICDADDMDALEVIVAFIQALLSKWGSAYDWLGTPDVPPT